MSDLYGDTHRELQDEFETRPLADRMIDTIVSAEISEDAQGFIESRPMFFYQRLIKMGNRPLLIRAGHPAL